MYAGACLDLPVSFSRTLRIFLQGVRLVLTGSVFAINRDRYMKKESVWNYPRPPHVEASARRARVYLAGKPVADTRRAIRVARPATRQSTTFLGLMCDPIISRLAPVAHSVSLRVWRPTGSCEWTTKSPWMRLGVTRTPRPDTKRFGDVWPFMPERLRLVSWMKSAYRPSQVNSMVAG
jgi:hypothetical protein